MARAYKCDGGLFEECVPINIRKSATPLMSSTTIDEQTYFSVKEICPECIAAIQKVIDERSANNANPM